MFHNLACKQNMITSHDSLSLAMFGVSFCSMSGHLFDTGGQGRGQRSARCVTWPKRMVQDGRTGHESGCISGISGTVYQ